MRAGVPRSRIATDAARLLGRSIALARRERRWTIAQLAERVGSCEGTMRKVERGDPSVALGTVFEAASLVGVRLFSEDAATRTRESELVDARLAVLPQRVRHRVVDDDF
ncbi:helix-turn-helix transcriptional regulator [Candidatus Poriferisodalis sp.]|uniref:helix-turn-helix transcriptional regulator n=1 Tax=Candidatus Poriferisodalis sp. TaxID=3101277 RepID=UPI003B51D688